MPLSSSVGLPLCQVGMAAVRLCRVESAWSAVDSITSQAVLISRLASTTHCDGTASPQKHADSSATQSYEGTDLHAGREFYQLSFASWIASYAKIYVKYSMAASRCLKTFILTSTPPHLQQVNNYVTCYPSTFVGGPVICIPHSTRPPWL